MRNKIRVIWKSIWVFYFYITPPLNVFTISRIEISCLELGLTANIISCVAKTDDTTEGYNVETSVKINYRISSSATVVSFSKSFLIFIPLSVYLLALIILCLCCCYIPLCDFKISDDEDRLNLLSGLGFKSVKDRVCSLWAELRFRSGIREPRLNVTNNYFPVSCNS